MVQGHAGVAGRLGDVRSVPTVRLERGCRAGRPEGRPLRSGPSRSPSAHIRRRRGCRRALGLVWHAWSALEASSSVRGGRESVSQILFTHPSAARFGRVRPWRRREAQDRLGRLRVGQAGWRGGPWSHWALQAPQERALYPHMVAGTRISCHLAYRKKNACNGRRNGRHICRNYDICRLKSSFILPMRSLEAWEAQRSELRTCRNPSNSA